MDHYIPLSIPNFCGNEKKYVDDALDGAWVSTSGARVNDFEECIANYLHVPAATATSSGSTALHLSAIVSGIGPGDEVIVPALTFIASVNPTTRYVGAEPIFVGCDETATMDPDAVEDFCANHCTLQGDKLINNRTGAHVKAMVIVHVFGNMADMPRLLDIAKRYHLIVIEDAAEALGTKYTDGPYAGAFAGTMGDVGAFSFNGNKVITTGTGGTLISNHPEWTKRAKHLSTQSKVDVLHFVHDEVGYNYRMTNIDACLGLAQMELLEQFIQNKIDCFQQYQAALDGNKGFRLLPFREGTRSNHWFFSLLLPDRLDRDTVIQKMEEQRIQTRPVWSLIPEQCDYARNEAYHMEQAIEFRRTIVNIPCSTNLTKEDCDRVIEAILNL